MVVSGSANLEAQVGEIASEIDLKDLSSDRYPAISRAEIVYCASIALGLACAVGLASSSPLVLFTSGSLLPIASALAALSGGGASVKQRYYVDQFEQLGARIFIERHGWERFAEYGADQTEKKELSALFGPLDLNHPRFWEGVRFGYLTFNHDAPLVTALMQQPERLVELREKGQLWDLLGALSGSLEGCEALCRFARSLTGEEVLEHFELLERLEIMPSPLCAWVKESAPKRREFLLTVESERADIEKTYRSEQVALEERFDNARKQAIGQSDLAALRDLQEEQESTLFALKQKFEEQMNQAQKRRENFSVHLEKEYGDVRSAAGAYFLFDALPLKKYAERFDADAIRKAVDQWGFPTREIWSERLALSPLDLNAPETLIGLELDLVTDGIRDALGKKEISHYATAWEIVKDPDIEAKLESNPFLKPHVAARFEELSPIDYPIDFLRAYRWIEAYQLGSKSWISHASWIEKWGRTFTQQEALFRFGDCGAFADRAYNRWLSSVWEDIAPATDVGQLTEAVESEPFDTLLQRFGWELIERSALELFRRRFFNEKKEAAQWLRSPALWHLIDAGAVSNEQIKACRTYLCARFESAFESGLLEPAARRGLIDPALGAHLIERLDPKVHRESLNRHWHWVEQFKWTSPLIRELCPWILDLDKSGFASAYADFCKEQAWRHQTLRVWAGRYGSRALLERMELSPGSSLDRWEREGPNWEGDALNFEMHERGLLNAGHIKRWMDGWLRRHPSFFSCIRDEHYEEILTFLNKEQMAKLTALFQSPSTFARAQPLLEHLEVIEQSLDLRGVYKLLHSWLCDNQALRRDQLERGFAAYKKEIGWENEIAFEFGQEPTHGNEDRGKGPLTRLVSS